jgi:hypothetical protein
LSQLLLRDTHRQRLTANGAEENPKAESEHRVPKGTAETKSRVRNLKEFKEAVRYSQPHSYDACANHYSVESREAFGLIRLSFWRFCLRPYYRE